MSSIEISKAYAKTPNSAGGVDVFHEIYNATEKEMKYITFTYVPYNSVGDMVSCTVKKRSEVSCKLTGPFKPGDATYVDWKNVWYNPTISLTGIKEVNIEYMDGSTETIPGGEILDIENPDSKLGKIREAERIKQAEEEEIARKKNKKKMMIIGGIVAVVAIILMILMGQ